MRAHVAFFRLRRLSGVLQGGPPGAPAAGLRSCGVQHGLALPVALRATDAEPLINTLAPTEIHSSYEIKDLVDTDLRNILCDPPIARIKYICRGLLYAWCWV